MGEIHLISLPRRGVKTINMETEQTSWTARAFKVLSSDQLLAAGAQSRGDPDIFERAKTPPLESL